VKGQELKKGETGWFTAHARGISVTAIMGIGTVLRQTDRLRVRRTKGDGHERWGCRMRRTSRE
jgi:hypothetical protein